MSGYSTDKKIKSTDNGSTLVIPEGTAIKGDTGEQGIQGEQGEQGERGIAGSGTFKQVEVDFGSNSVNDKTFSITDADITINSKLMAFKAIKSPSSGRHIDEIIVENIELMPYPKSGGFDLYAYSKCGLVSGKFIINYIIG